MGLGTKCMRVMDFWSIFGGVNRLSVYGYRVMEVASSQQSCLRMLGEKGTLVRGTDDNGR